MGHYNRSIAENHCVCNIANEASSRYVQIKSMESIGTYQFPCRRETTFKYVIRCWSREAIQGSDADFVPLVILGIACAFLLIFVFGLLRKVNELKKELSGKTEEN